MEEGRGSEAERKSKDGGLERRREGRLKGGCVGRRLRWVRRRVGWKDGGLEVEGLKEGVGKRKGWRERGWARRRDRDRAGVE